MSKTEPRIYVACLAAYNGGILHGEWIKANQPAEDIQKEVNAMLKTSPIEEEAEEWAIHDYEGFANLKLSEWASFENISRMAELAEEHGEVFFAILEHLGGTGKEQLAEAQRFIEEGYLGLWDSLEEYAENFADETGILANVPDNLLFYFDYDAYGLDMELSGDIISLEAKSGKIHIFNGHI